MSVEHFRREWEGVIIFGLHIIFGFVISGYVFVFGIYEKAWRGGVIALALFFQKDIQHDFLTAGCCGIRSNGMYILTY